MAYETVPSRISLSTSAAEEAYGHQIEHNERIELLGESIDALNASVNVFRLYDHDRIRFGKVGSFSIKPIKVPISFLQPIRAKPRDFTKPVVFKQPLTIPTLIHRCRQLILGASCSPLYQNI